MVGIVLGLEQQYITSRDKMPVLNPSNLKLIFSKHLSANK